MEAALKFEKVNKAIALLKPMPLERETVMTLQMGQLNG